ncbi:MAG: hypothetical protein HN348_18085 [Proteobacteria bacterium]|nr:hypothetical protein [Pseudomonadota bacterium]
MAPGLFWLLLSCGLGFILSLVFGILLIQNKKLPPALTLSATGVPILVGISVAQFSLWGWPGDGTMEAMQSSMAISLGCRLVLFLVIAPVTGLYLLFLAANGLLGSPRRIPWLVVGIILAIAVAATTVTGGYFYENPIFAWVRGVIYVAYGVLVAVAMLRGDPDKSASPEAAATAGPVFLFFVAAGETAERSLAQLLMVLGLPSLKPSIREEFIDVCLQMVEPEVSWYFASMGVAALFALVAVASALHGDGKRKLTIASALLWFAVAPAVYFGGHIQRDQLVEYAATLGPEQPAP